MTERTHAWPWSFPADLERIEDTTAGTRWTSGQFMDTRARWLPGGGVADGTWDLWTVNADGSDPHRLTSLPGSERSASWHPQRPFVYFHKDDDAIWRIPIDAAGRAGPAQPWLTLRDPSGRAAMPSTSRPTAAAGW